MKKLSGSKGALYLCAFFVPFVMTWIFFALCGVCPFGDSSILTGDMNIEFVNFYSYFVHLFHSKNDLSYMFAKTIGGDYPGLAAFQLHDPLLLILLLFPGEKIAFGIELLFSLQVSVAGLSASVLLNRRYRFSWMSLLFSTAYSFCAFFFGYLVLTIYFGSLMILPLVICFFLDFLDQPDFYVPYVAVTAFSIYVNYHMGFMLVIFLTLLYVSRIIEDVSFLKKWKEFVLSGITILLIDGFFLIRTGLSLLGEKTTEGADYGIYRNFPMTQLIANLFSGSSRNGLRPLIYCSVAALFFFFIYLMSGKYSIRKKLADLFLLSSVAVSMWINAIDAVWHGFNNPEGFFWRYSYYFSLIIIVLAYQGFLSLSEEELPARKKAVRIAGAAALIFLSMGWLIFRQDPYLDRERQIINGILTLAVAVFCLTVFLSRRFRAAGFALLLLISAADMLYDAKVIYLKLNANDGALPSMEEFREDYRSIAEAVDWVKAQDPGFYRLEKDFDRAVNDPAMFDYIGLSHDSSCEKDEILDWLTNFGFVKTVYYTYYNGGSTSFADALFGVKYFLSRFEMIRKPYEAQSYQGKYHVFFNEYALPMIFAAPEEFAALDYGEENTFEKQNRTAQCWGCDPIYKKAGYEVSLEGAEETEPGHYVRTGEEGYIVYSIPVTEELPLYFYFSAPERQSGEVFANGQSLGWYFTENHWNVLSAGPFQKGETAEIRMQILKEDLTITEPCFYYEDPSALDAWKTAADERNESIRNIEEITSSHLKFISSGEEETRVVVSVPCEDAWSIRCDGKKLQPERAAGMLLSFRVPEGEHEVDLKYVPEGTGIGLLVSAIGLLMFGAGIRRRRKRKEETA